MSSPEDVPEEANLLRLGADITSAYLANNHASREEVAGILTSVLKALSELGQVVEPAPETERPKPAVPISRSIQPDFIVCLEDGKKLKMLKRYLAARYNMTPEAYRRRWGLPPDYPMVAPSYATRRSEFARQIGLGRGVRGRSRSGAAET
jgi:predicted transcriptional regulator